MAINNILRIKNWNKSIMIMFMPVLWLLVFTRVAWDNLNLDEYSSVSALRAMATSLGVKDGLVMFSCTALGFALNYYWCKHNRSYGSMIWDYTKFMSTVLIICSICTGFIVYAMESA